MTDWEPPRCRHGAILLGCADDACPEQSAYVAIEHAAFDLYKTMLRENARQLVREALGLTR